jgi:hypothetical protein
MNKSDFSADKQLLVKLQDRLLTISMHYKAPKNYRMSQELVEKDGPRCLSCIKADHRPLVDGLSAHWAEVTMIRDPRGHAN